MQNSNPELILALTTISDSINNSNSLEFSVWNPTMTGWSSNPTGGIYYYCKIGKLVILNITQPNNGTSNATTCTLTLPFPSVQRTAATWSAPAKITDNNVTKITPGLILILNNATSLTCVLDYGYNAFTTSGNKKIDSATIMYECA